jgi:starvation-inducible outer membrane lipoprotein
MALLLSLLLALFLSACASAPEQASGEDGTGIPAEDPFPGGNEGRFV